MLLRSSRRLLRNENAKDERQPAGNSLTRRYSHIREVDIPELWGKAPMECYRQRYAQR